MNRHLGRILNVEKIALLLAVAIFGTVALEEPDAAAFANLLERFNDNAAHLALVIFVRAEDIEVLDAANVMVEPGAPDIQIEEVLGVGVAVERAQRIEVRFVGELRLESAVSSRRRCVDEARAKRD